VQLENAWILNATQLHMTIEGGAIKALTGVQTSFGTDGIVQLAQINSASGVVSINPANCRIKIRYTMQSTTFSAAPGNTTPTSAPTVSSFQGKAALVRTVKGFAGTGRLSHENIELSSSFYLTPLKF
jgi:hypothetical protein